MPPLDPSSSLDYPPSLNTARPRSHTVSTLDDFEGQLQHQDDNALASSSNGKPRASSSSFHGSSFQYSSFRPLFDESDDDGQEDTTTQFKLRPAPPPPSARKNLLLGSSAQPPPTSSSPSVSSLLPNQINQGPTPFHNTSFNYQSFRPLFDDSDNEEWEEAKAGGVEAANNRGRKASVEEGFEAVTPDLLPQRAAKEVDDGLKLDVAEAGKGLVGGWEKGRKDGQEAGGGGGAVVLE